MKIPTHSGLIPVVLAAAASLSAFGCGSRGYGRGLRRLAPFGVRAGWVDFQEFEIAEFPDRPTAGIYLRTSVKGRAVIELSADATLDKDAPDEDPLYSAGLSILFFPSKHGCGYLHLGGGAMSETLTLNEYLDGFVSAGAGYTVPLGPTRLDLRASMWQMIDSANLTRAFVGTVGYGF